MLPNIGDCCIIFENVCVFTVFQDVIHLRCLCASLVEIFAGLCFLNYCRECLNSNTVSDKKLIYNNWKLHFHKIVTEKTEPDISFGQEALIDEVKHADDQQFTALQSSSSEENNNQGVCVCLCAFFIHVIKPLKR